MASVEADVGNLVRGGGPAILLEHDLRPATIEVGEVVSGLIANASLINCPISAVFGDPQRYQGTKLTWPVVGPNGFVASSNPIGGDGGPKGNTTTVYVTLL